MRGCLFFRANLLPYVSCNARSSTESPWTTVHSTVRTLKKTKTRTKSLEEAAACVCALPGCLSKSMHVFVQEHVFAAPNKQIVPVLQLQIYWNRQHRRDLCY